MLVPFLIMFREGLEAALITGLIAGYLGRTGRREWLPLVWLGVGAGALASLAAGLALELLSAEFPQRGQEIFEAAVALVAVAMLTGMVFWMRRAAASVKAELQEKIEASLVGGNRGLALVGMVFLAVVREGLEATVFLMAVMKQSPGWAAPAGAVAGLFAALLAGLAIFWSGMRLNLRHFFRWTGLLILFVAAGLLAGALRALHEAGLWNGLQGVVFDLSDVLPADGVAGSVLAGLFGYSDRPVLGEVALYLLYLAVALPLFLRPARGPAAPTPAAAPRSRRLLRPALAMLGLLVAAVLGLGAALVRQGGAPQRTDAAPATTLAITADGCDPAELTIPAGRSVVRIVNRSQRALEWEVLDGVMVLEERENIAPGLSQDLTVRLQPGRYAMTCGRLSNPRGRLIVLAAGDAQPWRPAPRDLLGPMAEYKVYMTLQAMALQEAAEDLGAALAAGDSARAATRAEEAAAAIGRLRPALALLPDAAAAMQPGEHGLSRIAAQLGEGGTAVVPADAAAVLGTGAEALAGRIAAARIAPDAMAAAAAGLLRGEPLGSAAIEGVARIVTLLRPLAGRADPALAGRLDTLLAAIRQGDAGARAALAEDLDRLRQQLRVG
ncbi:MAG TPA: iron uptake transporter permease EfeU [Roseomonas sp.]|jgi:high-affinity iron transporter